MRRREKEATRWAGTVAGHRKRSEPIMVRHAPELCFVFFGCNPLGLPPPLLFDFDFLFLVLLPMLFTCPFHSVARLCGQVLRLPVS